MKKSLNRNKKAIIASSLALAMSMPAMAHAASGAQILMKQKTSSYISPQIETQALDQELVPVRLIAETLGAEVKWNGKIRAVTISRGSTVIVLTIGKDEAVVDNKKVQIGQAVTKENGNTLVPLKFINQALGSSVLWDADNQSAAFGKDDFAGLGSSFVYQLFNGQHEKAASLLNDPLKQVLTMNALSTVSTQYSAVYGTPAKQLTAVIEKNAVHTNVAMVYETDKASLEITVRFDQKGLIDDLYFSPAAPAVKYVKPSYDTGRYTEKEVVIGEGAFALPGTLTVPEGAGPFPVVVLVQGSGPHDRDSTIGGSKVFKDLAAGLAAQHIAVLRYEKVSREHTFKLSSQSTFSVKNESADDALRAVALLKEQKEIDASRIFVAGHSQGGYVMPIIIDNDSKKDIAGTVLLSAPSETMTSVLIEQQKEALDRMRKLELPAGLIASQEQAAAMWTNIVKLINDPKYSVDNMPADFPVPPAYWWYEQRNYEPAEAAQKQSRPMLILQGENDWQVSMKQFEGWKNALKLRTDVKFVSYPKVNHLLSEYDGLSIGMEYNNAAHVSAPIINDIAAWIKSVK
jgi:dienelactone hydrolase